MRITLLTLAASMLLFTGCSRNLQAETSTGGRPKENSSLPMIGYIDAPADGATVKGDFAIGGWTIWGQGVQDIQFQIDGSPMPGKLQMNIARPDVDHLHPDYQNPVSGWGAMFNTAALPAGTHKVTVAAKSSQGNLRNVGSLTLNIVKP